MAVSTPQRFARSSYSYSTTLSPSNPASFRADGNTLALASGTLLSVYSYEGKDGLHHVEYGCDTFAICRAVSLAVSLANPKVSLFQGASMEAASVKAKS